MHFYFFACWVIFHAFVVLCWLFQIFFFKFFQEHYQSVKQFGSGSGPVIFHAFVVVCRLFQKYQKKSFRNTTRVSNSLAKKSFRNTIKVSNSLDSYQDRHSVGPDLGPNCLQRLSATSKERVKCCIVCDFQVINCRWPWQTVMGGAMMNNLSLTMFLQPHGQTPHQVGPIFGLGGVQHEGPPLRWPMRWP